MKRCEPHLKQPRFYKAIEAEGEPRAIVLKRNTPEYGQQTVARCYNSAGDSRSGSPAYPPFYTITGESNDAIRSSAAGS